MDSQVKSDKKKLIIGVVATVLLIVAAITCVVVFVDGDRAETGKKPFKDSTATGDMTVAATYGNLSISKEEYSYGYMSLFNQVMTVVNQYNQYSPGYGAQYYDVTLKPQEQNCPANSLPEGVVTWADYFEHYATERAVIIKHLYNKATSPEAVSAGFAVSDTQQAEIDTKVQAFITQMGDEAAVEGKTIEEYIEAKGGYGLTVEFYKEQLKKEYISELYLLWYNTNLAQKQSKEDIDTYYNQNKSDFDKVTFRAFTVSYAEQEDSQVHYTRDEAMDIANDFCDEVTNETDFKATCIEYASEEDKELYTNDSATLLANYTKSDVVAASAVMAEWLFAESRRLYDSTVVEIEEQEAFFVLMVTKLPARDETPASADVRHLLIEYGDDPVAAKVEARSLLELWKENGSTEDAFVELVKIHTDDTASAETGGLYENINSSSSFVPEFLAWALQPHSVGDADIVETSYGYHLMYYVGGDTTPKWESDVREALAQIEYDIFYNDLYTDITENTVRVDEVCSEVGSKNAEVLCRIQGLNEADESTTSTTNKEER